MEDREKLAIIRLKKDAITRLAEDEERLSGMGFHLGYEIPSIKVIVKRSSVKDLYQDKPLLLNYGFVRIPIQYLKNTLTLSKIRNASSVISSFFYRRKGDIDLSVKLAEEEGLRINPVLIETIDEEELVFLIAEAQKVEVKFGTSKVTPGEYIVLMKYPFEGLGAKVLRKKNNGKVQVEILSTNLRIWLDEASLIYNIYDQEEI